ncbi:hypothetical protein Ais01nite_79470 [Asanoa ishikariensis]|uniref:FxsC C-terminal domain-containing protein n=1 Tax=Asanoa ishikariensis TaxID=137265 RepID=A0A1H3UMR1_9ACTN|nr:TIR-like protein FxsC [Asanoa ishikariensis]GIF69912.1 hypothetical protein Ais01nite_79470 [Asanoa ishikariensis]SDZ63566.1 FxsC C-terminal domain-containing protein [Asanoa ishikariensis]
MGASDAQSRAGGDSGIYFYLSYAHSPPTPDGVGTDRPVEAFFDDLSRAVQLRSRPGRASVGFSGQHVPAGADWNAVVTGALGAAQVFIPLYSPRYFKGAWMTRERRAFAERVAATGQDPVDRIMPVRWIPMETWDQTPETRRALQFGSDVPEYAAEGMRALCMVGLYREPYERLLDKLAVGIVDLAERSPLPPVSGRYLGPFLDQPTEETTAAPFVVAVTAPIASHLPPRRAPGSYGTVSSQWRPFAQSQERPIGEYGVNLVERLGLRASLASYSSRSEIFASAPALLLIDPWVAGQPDGINVLRAALKDLPEWVVPLVIADRDDPQHSERGDRLAGEVMTMLQMARPTRAERVAGLKEFTDIVPGLVVRAKRTHLKQAQAFPPQSARLTRPTLRQQRPMSTG